VKSTASTKVLLADRREFCKDLCAELIIKNDYTPIYPSWAMDLALQMVRLGWKKEREPDSA